MIFLLKYKHEFMTKQKKYQSENIKIHFLEYTFHSYIKMNKDEGKNNYSK